MLSSSDSEEETLLLVYLVNTLEAERIRRRRKLRGKDRNGKISNGRAGKRKKKRKRAKKNRKKRMWLNEDIVRNDLEFGQFYFLKQLITDDEKIFTNLNMTAVDFYELLGHLRADISKMLTALRKPLAPEMRLALTLRWLITGDNQKTIAETFSIGRSTVGKTILQVCTAICKILQPIVMPEPSTEMLCESAQQFEEGWQFPNCVGVLDGRHVLIHRNGNLGDAPDLTNYKADYSVVLFGITDSRNCFLAVDVLPGEQYQVAAFQNALLGNMLPEDNMPPPKLLPQSGIFLPHVVLGSEFLPHSKYVMTPYRDGTVKRWPEKIIYNDKHCRVLKVMDDTLGLMAQRYKVLQKPMTSGYSLSTTVIKACCYLHNFMRQKQIARNNGKFERDVVRQELAQSESFMPLAPYLDAASETGLRIRENFLIHFISKLKCSSGQSNC